MLRLRFGRSPFSLASGLARVIMSHSAVLWITRLPIFDGEMQQRDDLKSCKSAERNEK